MGRGEQQRAVPAVPVTLDDVARAAGVSLATASRVLNGGLRTPGAAMQERVSRSAARLGYSPNAQAQAMARGRTNIVGLIVPDIADPYFSSIAAGVMGRASGHDVLTTMADTRRDPRLEIRYVTALRQQRARAVILAGSRVRDAALLACLDAELARYRRAGGRVAVIGQRRLEADTVVVANRSGARAMAEALYVLGHRRFAVIGAAPDLLTSADRIAGFREGLRRRGITDVAVVHAAFTREGGYEGARTLLALRRRPRCIFAVTDVMAIGAMTALREAGIRVAQDVAIAGFDDIITARDVVPALTTVRVPLEELGSRAIALVLDPGTKASTTRVSRVPVSVVLRDSTRRSP